MAFFLEDIDAASLAAASVAGKGDEEAAPVPAPETAEAADADLDADDERPKFFENSRAAIRKCFRQAELVETKTNRKGETTRKFRFVCRDEFHHRTGQ